MRLSIKIVLLLVLSAFAAIAGHRLATGRYPSPGRAVAMTATIFLAVVVLDIFYGW
jgi:hypothetical protein